ncbi:hypothetical protein HQN89_27515 [Paenibacillus frigoriresistens]|uniref:hypothetical protein n=1 Tax=Paenibacillus alginolyticus TaxID=59839 RepID=UPI001563AA4F|nr:hypothetical protein [Paenibacillus frigoriresistens]NRF94652.1 hypothetical protein [Paenibacillus frigoriresistens]
MTIMELNSKDKLEVPEALHWDYGPDLPSKTLMLDVRGDKLHSYIKNMITASAILLDPKLSEGMFELTEREREVANMLLVCSTNAEIASPSVSRRSP